MRIAHLYIPCTAEPLEARLLFADEPWGAFPKLIHQDQAVADFPNINGAGESIAIIDTGVDYRHPALGGAFGPGHKVIAGYDFVDNDPDPMDTDGHGTGIAGIIAASDFTYGGAHYSGIAPAANIIALRVDDGGAQSLIDARIEKALQWVIAHRTQYNIVAVNLSQGSGEYSHPVSLPPYSDEMATLAADGVFIAAASGNSGVLSPHSIEYPAADPNAYAIGSVKSNDVISTFTERSADLDLLAPGENVPTPYYDPSHDNHYYTAATGTSFAAPFAAAAAALLKQANPALSPAQIISILRSTGSPNFDGDNESGPTTGFTFPRLNLDAAIAAAINPPPPQPPGPPVLTGTANDIAYDSSGTLHIAWFDTQSHQLKYASRSASGDWSSTLIVDPTINAGQSLSLSLDSKGLPAIAYYDASHGDLDFAHFNGHSFDITKVDTAGNTGQSPSLAYSNIGKPAIAYYDVTHGDLRFAVLLSSGWSLRTIDTSGDTGHSPSLAMNPSNGRWSVAYFSTSANSEEFSEKISATKWTITTVDKPKKVGGEISLAFDAAAHPAFSYQDTSLGDLNLARFDGTKWTSQTVASAGSVGRYSALFFTAKNQPDILYYDSSHDSLLLASPLKSSWKLSSLASSAGAYLSLATSDSGARTTLFRDSSTGLLRDIDF